MKRSKLLMAVAGGALAVGVATGALGAGLTRSIDVTYRNITIQVDGQQIQTDAEPFIVNASGRTVVPARALAEALGATVGWDDATSTVQVWSNRHAERTREGDTIRHKVPAARFQVAYPASFQAIQPGLLGAKLSLVRGPTTFHAFSEEVSGSVSTAQFADQYLALSGAAFKGLVVSGRENIQAYGRDVVEADVEWPADGVTFRGTVRLFVADGKGWVLIGLADRDAYPNLQAELKGIFDSFALLP